MTSENVENLNINSPFAAKTNLPHSLYTHCNLHTHGDLKTFDLLRINSLCLAFYSCQYFNNIPLIKRLMATQILPLSSIQRSGNTSQCSGFYGFKRHHAMLPYFQTVWLTQIIGWLFMPKAWKCITWLKDKNIPLNLHICSYDTL